MTFAKNDLCAMVQVMVEPRLARYEKRRDHAWKEYEKLFPVYVKAADSYNRCYVRLQAMNTVQLLAEVRNRPVRTFFRLELTDGSRILTWAILRHEYKRLRIASLIKKLRRLSRRVTRNENRYNFCILALARTCEKP